MSRDERVREGYGGDEAITRYAVRLMQSGVEALEAQGCEVLRIMAETSNSPVALYTLGEYHRRALRYDDALVWFRRCAESHPREVDAFLACADCYSRAEQSGEALKQLETALAIPNLSPKIKEEVRGLVAEVRAAIETPAGSVQSRPSPAARASPTDEGVGDGMDQATQATDI
jgi:tetratricopeptide (TPR) repeat protein